MFSYNIQYFNVFNIFALLTKQLALCNDFAYYFQNSDICVLLPVSTLLKKYSLSPYIYLTLII